MTRTSGFAVSIEHLDVRTSLVEVAGEIDGATAIDFQRRLEESIDDAHTEAVVVDLEAVTFVSSAALTALVQAFERRARHGRLRVAIAASDSRVTTIFEISRLDRVFAIRPTRAEALALVRWSL